MRGRECDLWTAAVCCRFSPALHGLPASGILLRRHRDAEEFNLKGPKRSRELGTFLPYSLLSQKKLEDFLDRLAGLI
jgi:hypothetical protein